MRIPEYDYSTEGYYFITICVQNRKCILSKINIDKKENTTIELLPKGKIVEKYIQNINIVYNDIKILHYTIMPNHIHFVCEIMSKEYEKKPKTLERIPFLISTFKRLTNKEMQEKIWQRNYYEHIIRNEREYLEILNYIENNKYNWTKDKYFEN